MTMIIDHIINCELKIYNNRKYLKDNNINIDDYDYEKKFNNIQTKLKKELATSFQLTESELDDYPKYLQTNYEKISGMLTPDINQKLYFVVIEMIGFETFLHGIRVGYEAKTKALGDYSGLIYSSSHHSPVGGRKYNCSMIIVTDSSSIEEDIRNMADSYGKFIDSDVLSQSDSTQLGMENAIIMSLCD